MEKFCMKEMRLNETKTTCDDGDNSLGFSESFLGLAMSGAASGFAWIVAPFYILNLLSKDSNPLPFSWRMLIKLLLVNVQLALCFWEVLDAAYNRLEATGSYMSVDELEPMLHATSLIVVVFVMEVERRKGCLTSGFLFVYWLLATISSGVHFFSKINYRIIPIEKEDVMHIPSSSIYFVLPLVQFILNCVAEPFDIPTGTNPCPELYASFLSKMTYWWANGLLFQGYTKLLTEEDVYDLNPTERSKTVATKFERQWKEEQLAIKRKRDGSLENKESSKLLDSSQRTSRRKEEKRKRVSLWKVIAKTFGWDILRAQVIDILANVIDYITPFLLSTLMKFIGDETMAVWKGYALATGFLCSMILSSVLANKEAYDNVTTGRKIRAALISSIYKKSMRMSNKARAKATTGEIVNLISVDTSRIRGIIQFLWATWCSPLNICFSMYFLYQTVGVAMFAGFSVMLILIPINAWIIRKRHAQEELQMKEKDNRIKLITEILNGIRILKLYAWELAFRDKVNGIREKELKIMRKTSLMSLVMHLSWNVAPFVMGTATFTVYLLISEDHRLDAVTTFFALSLFDNLQFGMNILPCIITDMLKARVSMRRVSDFLNNDEIDTDAVTHEFSDGYPIKVENATFSWDETLGSCLKNINLRIPEGKLVAVVGQVGAGKSSLLSAILGEMEKNTGKVNVDGISAFVSQQAWIQNATLRNNILFGNEMKRVKYDAVIEACALKPDLDILQGKDLTEIGEKGINLSGGQKQRVSLARAVYFDSDIYLLDDPLSAVDSHTGKHIFEKVIGNDGLLRNKTRILVTHGIRWLPKTDQIIVLSNGSVSEMGSYEQLMSHDGPFAQFLKTYAAEHTDSEESCASDDSEFSDIEIVAKSGSYIKVNGDDRMVICRKKGKAAEKREPTKRSISMYDKNSKADMGDNQNIGKLMENEEIQAGQVEWSVVTTYAKAIGARSAFVILLLFIAHQLVGVLSSVWLSNWTDNAELQNLETLPGNSSRRQEMNNYYLSVYASLGFLEGICIFAYYCINIFRTYRASVLLHKNMLTNVLRGPMSFFDTTPVGKIVSRFSRDIDIIDGALPDQILNCVGALLSCCSTVLVITYSTPVFLTFLAPMCAVYFYLQRYYLPTKRQCRHLESNSSSPIYSHFSETLAGIQVIRAFNAENRFAEEAEKRADRNHKFQFAEFTVRRWLYCRLQLFGALTVFAASMFAVMSRDYISGAIVGLSITYALRADIVSSHRPASKWPDHGKVEINSLSLQYREGLDLVLKKISAAIKPGEKVGIVGRTAAGKSSLTLSLFRLVEPVEGTTVVDGENISQLGLHDLRARLTILPQDPVIFSGSLRMNLDPLNRHTYEEIWTALKHAHLKSFVKSLPTGLDYECGEGGQNLSVGQKQLMCLARSLLRKTKIFVLDEATAAVDMETDDLIQQTINREFKECTVLTIAHRLNTVMDYDRILVLDKGEVKEFDTPKSLLQNPNSMFYSMAKDAGLI